LSASAASPGQRGNVCASLPRPSAPQLVYLKAQHQLCLFQRDGSVHQWPASHGREAGKKRFEGDERTPEGRYTLSPARVSRKFGLFMPISYPNAEDARAAHAQGKQPGSGVGIHGPQRWYAFLGEAQALIDHSDGCIVVDRPNMQALAGLVKQPLPLEIVAAD
ncbi:MAG TPA: L,D-transpeptidase family protein, partial [Polyangiales bacterium]